MGFSTVGRFVSRFGASVQFSLFRACIYSFLEPGPAASPSRQQRAGQPTNHNDDASEIHTPSIRPIQKIILSDI